MLILHHTCDDLQDSRIETMAFTKSDTVELLRMWNRDNISVSFSGTLQQYSQLIYSQSRGACWVDNLPLSKAHCLP